MSYKSKVKKNDSAMQYLNIPKKVPLKAQSAMEYLMTYGWSILIIAIALIILFELGVFNSNSLSGNGSCVAQPGYMCSNPILATNGILFANIGNVYSPITITGVACTSTQTPTTFNQIPPITLSDGEVQNFQFLCPLSSNALGTSFNGDLWIEYSNSQNTGLISQIGTVLLRTSIYGQKYLPVELYEVPITLSNQQSTGTPTNFQQMIYFNPSTYSPYINANLSNVEFTADAPAGTSGNVPLYSWIESGASSTATNSVIWINLASYTIGAEGSSSDTLTIYMNFLTSNSPVTSGYIGYPPQDYCSSGCFQTTFGQYNNIQNVMQGGLSYQIYYDSSGACSSTGYENQLYSALLGNQITVNGCATFISATPPFTTPVSGTSQDVNGGTQQNVIINYQNNYNGGGAYPNPPITNLANSWQIKAIGWVVIPSTTAFYGISDDGQSMGYSPNSPTSSSSDWLGGTSYPSNVFSDWYTQSELTYSGVIGTPGTYRIEYDYFENGGGSYTGLYSSDAVNYYSNVYPPNGVMPSFTIS